MSHALWIIFQILFVIADFCCFCFIIVGNVIVIYVISRDSSLKSKSSYHILSVSCVDLIIGLFGIPLGVVAGLTGAPHDLQNCLLLNSFLLSIFTVSMFSLVAVSIDRCWAVCFPLTYHVRSAFTTKVIIALSWGLGLFVGFLPMGWNSGEFYGKCDLRVISDFDYLLFLCVTVGIIPSISIFVMYFLIYRAVRKQAKKRQEIVANTTSDAKQRQEIKAAQTLGMVVGTFIVLWIPGVVMLFTIAWTKNRNFSLDAIELSTIMVHLNAAVDPIIYAYRMRNIGNALKKVFNCSDSVDSTGTSSSYDKSRRTESIRTISTEVL